MQKIQKYDKIDFNRIICADAEKKEFKDKKEDKQVTFFSIPVFYDRGDITHDCLIRLPDCNFFPLDERSDNLVIIYDKTDPDYEQLVTFFDKLKEKCAEFVSKSAFKIGKAALTKIDKALDDLRDPIFIKFTEDGKPKGAGNTYLKLIPPSPTRDSSLFIGPDRKVYPKKKLYGYSLRGSPVIKVDNIYCGQSRSVRFKLVQLDIREIKKLNSVSIDPDYYIDDPKVVSDFLSELEGMAEEKIDIEQVKEQIRKMKEQEDNEEEEVIMPN